MGYRLRVLSGKEVIKIMANFGFFIHSQKGSHIKLRRLSLGVDETLLIPNHDPISSGTLKAIFNQATKYIPKSELLEYFFRK